MWAHVMNPRKSNIGMMYEKFISFLRWILIRSASWVNLADYMIFFLYRLGSIFTWCLLLSAKTLLNFSLLYSGRLEDCKDCFRTFYGLMYLIHTYMKPHVSLLYFSQALKLRIYTRFLEYGYLGKIWVLLCWILLSIQFWLKSVIPFRTSKCNNDAFWYLPELSRPNIKLH